MPEDPVWIALIMSNDPRHDKRELALSSGKDVGTGVSSWFVGGREEGIRVETVPVRFALSGSVIVVAACRYCPYCVLRRKDQLIVEAAIEHCPSYILIDAEHGLNTILISHVRIAPIRPIISPGRGSPSRPVQFQPQRLTDACRSDSASRATILARRVCPRNLQDRLNGSDRLRNTLS